MNFDGNFRRIGGMEDVEVDLRIIATTHRNLEEEVVAGRFRDDLFYHLNVVPLHIPPLREHEAEGLGQVAPQLLRVELGKLEIHQVADLDRLGVALVGHLTSTGTGGFRGHPEPG